jgi:hypothetical protein
VSYQVMIDAMHTSVVNIPENSPLVAGYVTGTPEIAWTAQDWARFPGGHLRVDQSPDLAQWAAGNADVADIEQGAGTSYEAVAGAMARTGKGWLSWVYTSQANLASLRSALEAAQLTGHVQFWVANWDLSEEEAVSQLSGDVVAIQFASPSSNPVTIVPGSVLTLAQANADLSVTIPGWFTKPASQSGLVITSALKALPVTSADGKTWLAS